MKNIILFLIICVGVLMAEDEVISPADLTQVKSFAWLETGSREFTARAGFSGEFTKDFKYLALIGHTRSYERGDEKDDKTRVRLFAVHKVSWEPISYVGASIDYIKSYDNNLIDNANTTAYGTIAKIETGVEWIVLFPNVAYITSDVTFKDNKKLKSKGYLLNLFASIYLDRNGKYIMLQPQYSNTEYLDTKKIEVSYGQPISNDMKWWLTFKAGYEKNEIDYLGIKDSDTKEELKIGLIYYF